MQTNRTALRADNQRTRMHNSAWRFTRASHSMSGFKSTNTASTDALNALQAWITKNSKRQYAPSVDRDSVLIATLECPEEDAAAGSELDAECVRTGVARTRIELVSPQELSAWLTERVQSAEDLEGTKVSVQYPLVEPDDDGCNWSDQLVLSLGPNATEQAAGDCLRAPLPEARQKFNLV